MKGHYPFSSRSLRAQQGSVLLWGLVILITLTVISVAAARMGVTDTRIANNQVLAMMTYQGAESALERTTALFNVGQTDSATGRTQTWDYPGSADNNAGILNASATMTYEKPMMCTAQNGYGMSVEMNPDLGGITCFLFTVDSRANLAGTGANSEHEHGIMKYSRADGNSVQ